LRNGDIPFVQNSLGEVGRLLFDGGELEKNHKADFEKINAVLKENVGFFRHDKFVERMQDMPDKAEQVIMAVIVADGSLNVAHRGHVRMLHQAATRLERAGYHVLGAWLVPWSQEASENEAKSKTFPALSKAFRTRVLELATCDDPFVRVGSAPESLADKRWAPHEIVGALQDELNARFIGTLQGYGLRVFYACGMESAMKSKAHKRTSGLDAEKYRGCIVIPRDQDEDGVMMEDVRNMVYVADMDRNDVPPMTCGLSGTKLREHIRAGNVKEASQMMPAAAARFVLAPTPKERREFEADYEKLGVKPALVAPDGLERLRHKLKGCFQDAKLQVSDLDNILTTLDPSWTSKEFTSLCNGVLKGKAKTEISVDEFIDWIFACCAAEMK
jgi:hypothetical protein